MHDGDAQGASLQNDTVEDVAAENDTGADDAAQDATAANDAADATAALDATLPPCAPTAGKQWVNLPKCVTDADCPETDVALGQCLFGNCYPVGKTVECSAERNPTCNDDNIWTADSCDWDPSTGKNTCFHECVPSGKPGPDCEWSESCTLWTWHPDICACVRFDYPNCCSDDSDCDDDEPCTTDTCDISEGTCSYTPTCCRLEP
ncbi:MAG: hypothetical protein H6747_04370 [Deltaproteobacteria bacterium]|nr:hypothetical protein [Deltaproteobacteria bacterium]